MGVFKRKKSILLLAPALSLAIFSAVSLALPEPLPDPFHPELNETEIAKLTVDSYGVSGTPQTSTINLPKGQYTVYSSGVYSYGGPRDGTSTIIADAECAVTALPGVAQTSWERDKYAPISAMIVGDYLDLYVDGKAVDWIPVSDSISGLTGQNAAKKAPKYECDQASSRTSPPDDPTKHLYWIALNWRGGPLAFKITENGASDNYGVLTVSIRVPNARAVEEFVGASVIPADSPAPITSPELIVGQTYRLEASGRYQFTNDPKNVADAECMSSTQPIRWTPKLDPNNPDPDTLDLWVEDGTPNSGADGNMDWQPITGPGGPRTTDAAGNSLPSGSCNTDSDRVYQVYYTAKDPGTYPGPRNLTTVQMKISDSWGGYFDNVGALIVRFFHVSLLPSVSIQPSDPGSTAGSAGSAGQESAEPVTRDVPEPPGQSDPTSGGCGPATPNAPCATVSIDSSMDGSISSIPLPAGRYLLEVSGIYQYYNGVFADAECSRGHLYGLPDSSWQRNRFPHGAPNDPLDLNIDGQNVEWTAKGTPPRLCQDGSDQADPNSVNHVYNLEFNHAADGPFRFSIYDPAGNSGLAANSGVLTVRIYKPAEIKPAVGVVTVSSNDPIGTATPVLVAGKAYRLEVSGLYTWYGYGGKDFDADAECSIKGNMVYPGVAANQPGWTAHRFDQMYGGDPLDVYLGGAPITWVPKVGYQVPTTDPLYGCSDPTRDPHHTYSYTFTPSLTGPVTLRIAEREPWWYTDNTGFLTVTIYLV